MANCSTEQPFSPFLLVLAGMLIGSSNGALSSMQWLRANAEPLLLTAYTLSVAVYLIYITFKGPIKTGRPVITKLPPLTREPPLCVATETSVESPEEDQEEPALVTESIQEPPVNLSGAYKLISNNGFEEFLAVQGVPYMLRKAANGARPVHRLTQQGSRLTIKIEGIIESQTTYIIGGPPVETNVRGRIFEDTVAFGENSIVVSKRAVTEDYDVTVVREPCHDGQQLTLTSTAFFKDGKDPVKSVQLFQRIE